MVEHFNKPNGPGWYWFLPDENCRTPVGFLPPEEPGVVLVTYQSQPVIRKMRLAVTFSFGPMWVDELSGDWEKCPVPRRIYRKARKRQESRTTG